MKVFVSAFVFLFAAGFVPAKELSRMPVLSAAAEVGPVSSPETDPRILSIRAAQDEALSRGDRVELKRLEGEVQAILLSRQPVQAPPGLELGVVMPEANFPAFLGPDAVIDTGTFLATGADYMMDGTMYVTAFRTSDTVNWFYRSTDHGSTWQQLVGYSLISGGSKVPTRRLGLCVGEGDSAFLYMFLCSEPPYEDLYQIRTDLDGYGATLTGVHAGPDTVTDFAVCRDYTGSNYWLYAVAVNDQRPGYGNGVSRRSTDYGKTWAITDTWHGCVNPHYSFGAGSWMYLAWTGPDTFFPGSVKLAHNPVFGAHGQWWATTVWPDTFGVSDPVIAPAFTLPESSAVIWTLLSHNYQGSGDWDMMYSWSTNGGHNWERWEYLSGEYDSLERFPDLRNYTDPGNTYVNGSYIYESNARRTVFRHYASSGNPGTWSDSLRINTNSAGTGRATRPLLVYSPGGPGSGAGCVFVGAGLRNLYFNSPWLTALAEAGSPRLSPGPRALLCRGAFDWPGSLPTRLFNAAGRSVALVMPGANDLRYLPVGVYQILAAQGQGSRRIVIAR